MIFVCSISVCMSVCLSVEVHSVRKKSLHLDFWDIQITRRAEIVIFMYSVTTNKQCIHVKFHPDRIKGWREILKKLFFGVRKKSLHVLIPIRGEVRISGFFDFLPISQNILNRCQQLLCDMIAKIKGYHALQTV